MRTAVTKHLSLFSLFLLASVTSGLADDQDLWPGLRAEVFQGRDISENDGVVTLYAPDTAVDAALVPLSVRFPASVANDIKTLTLIIDRNPSPVVATFHFGDGFRAGPEVGERVLETRARIDSFSKVRAIAETSDGKLHMSAKFVTGAGGCSAIASKDPAAALADLGKIQVKTLKDAGHGESWRDATVMIRHPNFTGMQMDPISRGYTPLRIVKDLTVKRGNDLVFEVDGGISISENPHFRFNFDGGKGDELAIEANDTEGLHFTGRSTTNGS